MKDMYNASILLLKSIMQIAEKEELTNTQEFLDWEDEINKLSVKY